MADDGRKLIPDAVYTCRGVVADVFDMSATELSTFDADWLRPIRDSANERMHVTFEAMKRTLATAGDRALTRNQQAAFDQGQADLETLGALRSRLDEALAVAPVAVPGRRGATPPEITAACAPCDLPERHDMTSTAAVPTHRGAVLAPEQRVADYVQARGLADPHTERLNLGKALRGMVLGEWAGADAERRAMSEGVSAGGGFLVPTALSSEIIDLARNAGQVFKAGAKTVPMESQTENVPRQITDPAVSWRLENAAINNSGPTFDLVQFIAKSLACITTVSRELVEDSKRDIHALLMDVISKAIALEIDRVALRGSGTPPEPQGVRNTAGVPITSLGTNGAAATWDAISSAVQLIRGANFEPTAAIYSPRTAGGLARLKDSQGRYLEPPVDLAGLANLATAQVRNDLTQGTSNLASDIYVGDWTQLWVGVRTQLQITILQERYADLGQIGVVAWWRGDVQVAHPLAFNVLTGAL